jgi:RHS repeat-associated protein
MAFTYDGQGRRVSQTVGTARTDAWYDLTGLTLETGASSATYLRDPSGSLRSISSGGAVHNYAQDRLGSITALVETSGTLANSYTYDPWGQLVAQAGTRYNPYQYTGTYLDEATGLNQMGARYYQPGSGRFTQLDPLACTMMEGQRYTYAKADPANLVDPDGLYPGGACYWSRAGAWKWWGLTAANYYACRFGCGTVQVMGMGALKLLQFGIAWVAAAFGVVYGPGACFNRCETHWKWGWLYYPRWIYICDGSHA